MLERLEAEASNQKIDIPDVMSYHPWFKPYHILFCTTMELSCYCTTASMNWPAAFR
jgi:hypothetical protein